MCAPACALRTLRTLQEPRASRPVCFAPLRVFVLSVRSPGNHEKQLCSSLGELRPDRWHFSCSRYLYQRQSGRKGGRMFTDKIELKNFDKMDPEYKDLLGRVLTIQADCEIGGPHLYVEKMLPAAPTKLD